eukprot:91997_1
MLSFLLTLTINVAYVLSSRAPNVVFILTDDQDVTLGGFSMMPKTTKLIVEEGLTFNNAFVHTPICCISRASFLSGRYVHNHNTINNTISGNCGGPKWRQNTEGNCYAPYVRDQGYNTMYAGKYLNSYGLNGNNGGTTTAWIPKGWQNWFGLVGNSRYYGYSISNNGKTQSYGQQYITDYYTNVLREQALSFLDIQTQETPFLMVVATPAAHAPFVPAPQYNNTAEHLNAPRTPNWNSVKRNNGNKHQLMQAVPEMDAQMISQSDYTWRWRLGTLKSVDDLVEAVVDKIAGDENDLDINNTYFIYASDHGFHSGQFGMMYDKRQLYENDIRIPFVIRGPGVPKNQSTDQFALNIDIAPTIVDIATGKIPNQFDGMSLLPYLNENKLKNEATANQQFLIEYYGEQYDAKTGVSLCYGYPGFKGTVCDMWNNSYNCIRTINTAQNQRNGTIYCEFNCYDTSHVEIGCDPATVQGQGEYYDLDKDYYELDNIWSSLNANQLKQFKGDINTFMNCSGQTSCNGLRLVDEEEKQYYFDYIHDKLV